MKVNCHNCSVGFESPPSYLKKSKSGRHFCSRSCSASFNNHMYPKRKLEGKCTVCSKSIPAKGTYCSGECKANRPARPSKSLEEKRACNKRAVVAYRRRIKTRAIVYKGGSCSICSYSRCQGSLQFHHTDPTGKEFRLSAVTRSWDRIKPELDKCILVCANCHGEIHAGLIDC